MSWDHPLILALIPAVLVAVWWIFRRARAADGPAFAHIHRRWADRHGLSDSTAATRRRVLRGFCLAVAASAALLALARPQWGEIAEPSYDQSREVVLALDLSRSMLADDVAPSRLARAKLLIQDLLDQLKGERVGLVVFSGTAFVQSPLSADYEVLRDFLAELDPSYLPEGGTDYTAMLRTATEAFGQQGNGDRYLVVLSDGEALDEGWQKLLPTLHARDIRVIGLGVGTPEGALVPDGQGGLVKDEHGAAVLSRLEPATLQALASESGGTYRDAATWVDIAELVGATVEQGKKGQYVEHHNVRLQDRFQWFLAPAVLFLLLSYWLEFPVSPLARALQTRGRRPHPASAPALAAALMALAAWHSTSLASTAVPDTLSPQSGTASQPNPLTATVAELSSRPQLAAADYARLATDTIAFASQPTAPKDASRAGVIDDALAAVDRGQAADTHAADWPALRTQLEQLKQVKEKPPQQQPQDQQQNQQKEDQQGQQDQPQDGQQGQDSKQDQQGQQGKGAGQEPNQSGQGEPQQKHEPAKDAASGTDQQQADQHTQPSAENDSGNKEQKDQQSAGSADRPEDGKSAAAAAPDAQHPAENQPEDRQAGAGEVQRQDDVKPSDAPEAGLGDQDHDRAQPQQAQPQDAQAPAAQAAGEEPQAPPKPATRLVGGGRASQDVAPQGDPALAEALAKMERVKDGDAPAVLFDRMNRADGQPRPQQHVKNW